MNVEHLRIFAEVMRSGSFTRAAEQLRTPKSHVSRVVAQLEATLGVTLIDRSTRALHLTDVGKDILERANHVFEGIDDILQVAQNIRTEPEGVLRVTCGVELGRLVVDKWVNEFLASNPGVDVVVEHTSRVIDMIHEGFDVAIRVGSLIDSRLVTRRLGTLHFALFAAPDYLDLYGVPESPADLRHHRLIFIDAGPFRRGWKLKQGTQTARAVNIARLRVNNSFAVRDSIAAGLGIGLLPHLISQPAVRDGMLLPILDGWAPDPGDIHMLFQSQRQAPRKVRAFIDFIAQRSQQDLVRY